MLALIAQGTGGGTGRYARELITRLGNECFPIYGVKLDGIMASYAASLPIMTGKVLSVRDRATLIHDTNAYAPVILPRGGRAKKVMTWHDIFPLLYGNWADRALFSISLKNYQRTSALIYNSEETGHDLRAYLERRSLLDSSKAERVIPLGVADSFLRVEPFYGPRSDFAFVGLIHNRHKDLRSLLRVFSAISRERDCRLHVFTSREDSVIVNRATEKSEIKKLVMLHVDATDEELALSLSRMVALLHVVKAEGFGLPILESLAVGTPVLIPSWSRVPKVTSLYAYVGDEESLVDKAVQLLDSPRPAERVATAYARSFTWDRTVKETKRFYDEIVSL
ncbi:MAG: glycosyltransferase [Thermoprotei archaeon]